MRRLISAGLVVAGLLPAFIVAGMTSPQADFANTSGIVDVGWLERIAPDVRKAAPHVVPKAYDDASVREGDGLSQFTGSMIMVPQFRQIWHLYPHGIGKMAGAVRDLDSMKLLRVVELDTSMRTDRATRQVFSGEWTHTVDPKGRLFLYGLQESTATANDEIVEIDLKTFAVQRYPLRTQAEQLPYQDLGALTYDPVSDSLIAVFGDRASQAEATLMRLDLKSKTRSLRPVAACTGSLPSLSPAASTYNVELLVSDPKYVFLTCHRAGLASAVVRIPRETLTQPNSREDIVVGPVYLQTTLADQGSGRLFLVTQVGEAWVFDTKSMSFIGVISAYLSTSSGVSVGWGVDPVTGRLYFQSGSFGFGVAEGRFFPIPQALTRPDRQVAGRERIWSDAKTNRVFVLEGTDGRKSYRIYRVPTAPPPPPPPDPDANTVDRPEKPGLTDSRPYATASGYGVRVLFARGISAVPPAPAVGIVTPTAQVLTQNLNSRCGFDDREISAARVAKTQYDGDSAVANAIEFDLDSGTQEDIERPSNCHIDAAGGPFKVSSEAIVGTQLNNDKAYDSKLTEEERRKNRRYFLAPAECTTSGGEGTATGKSEPNGATGSADVGIAEVSCPTTPTAPLTGYAHAKLHGDITVHESRTDVKIERVATGGVRSTVTSYVRGLVIAGQIRIGEIKATATSFSNGRKRNGAEGSTYDLEFSDVVVAGTRVCEAACRHEQIVPTLNTFGAGQIQFRVAGGMDEELLRGSDGGALTAVQKSAERQASDISLIGDFTSEIPGLEMVVYNDNKEWGRARQLYQFAGVTTAASYFITLQPSGDGFGPELPEPELPDEVTPRVDPPVVRGPDGTPGPAAPKVSAPSAPRTVNPVVAIARGLRLLFTDPRHALPILTAWMLLLAPPVLAVRRRRLAEVRAA